MDRQQLDRLLMDRQQLDREQLDRLLMDRQQLNRLLMDRQQLDITHAHTGVRHSPIRSPQPAQSE